MAMNSTKLLAVISIAAFSFSFASAGENDPDLDSTSISPNHHHRRSSNNGDNLHLRGGRENENEVPGGTGVTRDPKWWRTLWDHHHYHHQPEKSSALSHLSSESIWTSNHNTFLGPISIHASLLTVGKLSDESEPKTDTDQEKEAPNSKSSTQKSRHRKMQQQRKIGDPYFRLAGGAIVEDNDDKVDSESFGKSISMSDDGMMLAISGNLVIKPEEAFAPYVELYRYDNNLNAWNLEAGINTTAAVIGNEAHVEVQISGNAMRLAVAVVYKEDSSIDSISTVTVYEHNDDDSLSSWDVIGTPLSGGFHGDRPGLKVAMSHTGERLVVGSRYYTDTSDSNNLKIHAGRTRVFTYTSGGEWTQIGSDLVGDSMADYAGSSVALTPDGSTLAIGATGDDNTEGKNAGRVKVYTFNTDIQDWEQLGNEITGEAEDDESGFSIAIAKGGTRVAVGAIYNDGDNGDLRHSGHVRVYDYIDDGDNRWEQIGSDIDGDHGSVYDGNYFHVGDAFGFSVVMSTDGNKLAIGAPFYSKNRLSGYYGGVAKLYEFVSNQWSQVAYDLNVTDTDATSGYSVALSGDGGRFAIGIPSLDVGMVLVYDQYEVSSFPSLTPSISPSDEPSSLPTPRPSLVPSEPPSDIPTKEPSSSPFNQPSFIPSRYPSILPSATPSDGPTAQVSSGPSGEPSYQPSDEPSSQPTNVPSIKPSDKPSHGPSSQPSDMPSNLPSVQPSISPSLEPTGKPSQDPSSLPSGIPSAPPFIQPSDIPSLKPSANPSIEPSSGSSARPSVYPSDKPSIIPSTSPSDKPSIVPSSRPSGIPSINPSDQPSIIPSTAPSTKPSIVPSSRPSSTPSISPTALPSILPSQNPTSISDRTFKIRSSYALFDKFTDGDTTWCMQASGFGHGSSSLNVRKCSSNPSQLWYLDSSGNLSLRKFPTFCVVYEGRKLYILSCDQVTKSLVIDQDKHSIYVTKQNNKKFYVCVDTFKAFSKLSLMTEGRKNSSWNTWHVEYEDPSSSPSEYPSSSSLPSIAPSFIPSIIPSVSPSNAVPSLPPSQIPLEDDYELVYSLDIPIQPNYRNSPPEYSIDNHLAITSFTKVAYYLELDDEYVWVSMDTFTTDARQIGVPCVALSCGNGSTPSTFQQLVSNMKVISNVPGLSGSGLIGNVEFFPYGYNGKNAIGISGASSNSFDFGDTQTYGRGYYGCMQVHVNGGGNYVGTVFAFNQFQGSYEYADLGIGNRSKRNPDWTYAWNSNTYNIRNLKVYTYTPPIVPELEYELVYSLDIPARPNYRNSHPQYSIDNHLTITSFTRVAYYLELDDEYVWVSMDTFTPDPSQIGVPCLSLACGNGSTRTVIQQVVSNMKVISNVPGLSGSGLIGNVEFWPYGYYRDNGIDIPRASKDVFDFGDRNAGGGNYGCMQVHVHGGGKYIGTVFAFNYFNNDGFDADADLGIGNQPIDHPDWTYAHNARSYNVRKLKVYTYTPPHES